MPASDVDINPMQEGGKLGNGAGAAATSTIGTFLAGTGEGAVSTPGLSIGGTSALVGLLRGGGKASGKARILAKLWAALGYGTSGALATGAVYGGVPAVWQAPSVLGNPTGNAGMSMPAVLTNERGGARMYNAAVHPDGDKPKPGTDTATPRDPASLGGLVGFGAAGAAAGGGGSALYGHLSGNVNRRRDLLLALIGAGVGVGGKALYGDKHASLAVLPASCKLDKQGAERLSAAIVHIAFRDEPPAVQQQMLEALKP